MCVQAIRGWCCRRRGEELGGEREELVDAGRQGLFCGLRVPPTSFDTASPLPKVAVAVPLLSALLNALLPADSRTTTTQPIYDGFMHSALPLDLVLLLKRQVGMFAAPSRGRASLFGGRPFFSTVEPISSARGRVRGKSNPRRHLKHETRRHVARLPRNHAHLLSSQVLLI